jgi:hypothetical protein
MVLPRQRGEHIATSDGGADPTRRRFSGFPPLLHAFAITTASMPSPRVKASAGATGNPLAHRINYRARVS